MLAYVLVAAKATKVEAAQIKNVAKRVAGPGLASLTLAAAAGTFAAAAGRYYIVEGGVEMTLPAPEAGAEVALLLWTGTHSMKVKAPSGTIFAYGTTASPITIYVGQPVRFISDGTNWELIGDGGAVGPGSASAQGGRVERVNSTAYEPHASRPTVVTVEGEASEWLQLAVYVNGVFLAEQAAAWAGQTVKLTHTLWLAPGDTWEVLANGAGHKVFSSYRFL